MIDFFRNRGESPTEKASRLDEKAVRGYYKTAQKESLARPPVTAGKVAGMGVKAAMAGFEMNRLSERWGAGFAALYVGASHLPYIGGVIQAGEMITLGAEASYEYETSYRKKGLDMGTPTPDPFGHSATMRQESMRRLGRGRSFLGQEAGVFHL